uniref:alpha/beta fold hydrolase n=2 Tax=Algoriphagus sp. TaxID=1872435 RepID=UPI004047F143
MIWIKRVGIGLIGIFVLLVVILAFAYRSDLSSESVNEKYLTSESRFIAVNGLRVHVRILGEGEPVFLLHGSFASLHTWDAWQQAMSPYYQTISLDFPGHGLTGPDSLKRYGIKDYSKLVQALAEDLELTQYHVAGNSMGGAVAMQLASDYPKNILSLNLIDAAGAPAVNPVLTDSSAQKKANSGGGWIFQVARHPIFSKLLLSCTPKFLFEMNMKQVYGDDTKVTEEVTMRYYELMLREGNRQATLDRLSQPRTSDIHYERLTMPTLILWGAEDQWIPLAQGKRLQEAIPGANLVILDGVGHVPMEESPTETVSEYLSFLGVEVRKSYLHPSTQVAYAK